MADSLFAGRRLSAEAAGKRGRYTLFFYIILDFLTENVYDNKRMVRRMHFKVYGRLKKSNKL